MDTRFWRGLALGAVIGWALSAYASGAVRQMRVGMAEAGAGRRGAGGSWRGWMRRRRGVVPSVAAPGGIVGGTGTGAGSSAGAVGAAAGRPTYGIGGSGLAATTPRRGRVWRAWRRRELAAAGERIVTQPVDQAFAVRRPLSRQ